MKAWFLSSILTVSPLLASLPGFGSGTCSGVVRISDDPNMWAELDCENPCADLCSTFFVMTPCGEGAQCGCSSSGPNSGPDVALFPPAGNGIPCMVGTCPDGQPPEKALSTKRGRRSPTGRFYHTIFIRAQCRS